MQYYTYFGSTYGSSTYDSSTYNGATSTTPTGTTTNPGTTTGSTGASSAGGSVLTNTGFDIAASAALACVIIFAALMVRLWRRPAKQS